MNHQKRDHEPDDRSSQPSDQAKKKGKVRGVGEEKSPEPSTPEPSTARVVHSQSGMRLTTEEWKMQFAENFDRLVRLIGLSRRDAAREIGISYPLLKRLITAGVSRTDDRNMKSLTRIASFFGLPNVEALWRDDLVRRLIFSDKSGFVEKFRERLLAEREKRQEGFGPVRREELALLNRALGCEDTHVPMLTGSNANKVANILASSEADTFQRLIDSYDELVTRRADDRGRGRE
jgi:hypothetical protein